MAQTQFPERARIDNANGHLVVQRNLDFLRDTVDANFVPDASPSVKGKIKLAGDLSGTADSPQIAAGVITNADIAAAAAIDGRKIQWNFGTNPPASPSEGDIWIRPVSFTGGGEVTNNGQGVQMYIYYPTGSATYPWHFIGGPPYYAWVGTATVSPTSLSPNAWQSPYTTDPNMDIPRAGDHIIEAQCMMYPSTNACTGAVGIRVGSSDPTGPYDGTRASGGYHPVSSARVPYNLRAHMYGQPAGTHLQLRYAQAAGAAQTMGRANASIVAWPIRIA